MTEKEINKAFDEEYIKYRDAFPKDYDIPALAQPAPVQYPLPDDMYDSKDWRDADYAGRVEWLHTMYESSKRTLDAYTTPPAQPAPVQEPVAIALNTGTKQGVKWLKNVEHRVNLYTTPPAAQREFVGLTDEEAQWLYDNCRTPSNLIDMTEATLKEKNT